MKKYLIIFCLILLFACNAKDSRYYEKLSVERLTTLAERDNIGAQTQLAGRYYQGEGVERDYSEGVKWYRRAAEQGDAEAQYYLASSYYNGHGIKQNFTEAAKWYRRAADQEHAGAQFSLGIMYYNGIAVEKNITEAVRWYRKAAELGDAGAQYFLGEKYEEGVGVEKNIEQAYFWVSLAVLNTDDIENFESYRRKRYALETLLSPDQITNIKNQVAQWREEHRTD